MAGDQHKEKGKTFTRRSLLMAGGQAVLMNRSSPDRPDDSAASLARSILMRISSIGPE